MRGTNFRPSANDDRENNINAVDGLTIIGAFTLILFTKCVAFMSRLHNITVAMSEYDGNM